MEAKRGGAGLSGRRTVGLALGSLLLLGGCGGSKHPTVRNVTVNPISVGSGVKQFSAPGMQLHFDYPASFRIIPLAPSKRIAGTNAQGTHAAVGIGHYDLIIISRFPGLHVPVTAANLPALKPSFDALVGQVFGRTMDGTVGTAGGRPAIFWARVRTSGLPVAATTEPVNVFVGRDEYEIQCQATPTRLAAIEAACKELFATLRITPT